MANEIQIFSNETFGQLRTIKINGEIWFVAKDGCDALEIKKFQGCLNKT